MSILFICFNFFFLINNSTDISHSEWTIKTDDLDNIYVYNHLKLEKYNSEGKLLFTYSNSLLGDISLCDPSDPFNVVLYFSDFRNLIILDSNLNNKVGTINLNNFLDDDVDLISRSSNGDFLFYISSLSQVLRFSPQGHLIDESVLLSLYLNEQEVDYMSLYNEMCYLVYNKNILVKLDDNLQFISKLYLPKAEKILLDKDKIYFLNSGKLYLYDTTDGQAEEILVKQTFLANEIIINQGEIIIYNKGLLSIEHIK